MASFRDLWGRAAPALRKPCDPTRDAEHRRSYIGRPLAYIKEILGRSLSADQERLIMAIEENPLVGCRAGNSNGKTFCLAQYVVYYIDCVGEDLDEDGNPSGARVILIGPGHSVIRAGLGNDIVTAMARAESRGHAMAGRIYSGGNQTILWKRRAHWEVEMMAPRREAAAGQAHSGAGRHGKYMLAILEEVAGVPKALYQSAQGMCVGDHNKVVGVWNPTEKPRENSAVADIEQSDGGWHLMRIRSIDHENIKQRRAVFEGAIGVRSLERDIRKQCEDMGPADSRSPNPDENEFVYALPPSPDSPDPRPREDGILGHADGEPRIYRPDKTTLFAARYLGEYPANYSGGGLFDPLAIDESFERWARGQDPERPPERVAYDAAGQGGDEHVAAPIWFPKVDGEVLTPEEILRRWIEFPDPESREYLQEVGRIRIGRFSVYEDNDAGVVARRLWELHPDSQMMAEGVGDGSTALSKWRELGATHQAANPSGKAPERLDGEWACGNERAAMFCRLRMLLSRGLVDLPPDELLREELLTMQIEREREKVYLVPKNWIRHRLGGRSPDRGDTVAMAAGVPFVAPRKGRRQILF